nr:TraB/GumN family protein [Kofleriaceae bacterium]
MGTAELRSRVPLYAAIGTAVAAVAIVAAWLALAPAGDHPPDDAERRELADDACPRVTEAHFYVIDKAGKRSYLLGTRHAGVALAKYPPAVAAAWRAPTTTTAVFESNLDVPATAEPAASGPGVDVELGDDLWSHYRDLVGDDLAERVRTTSIGHATAVLALLYEDTSQTVDAELFRDARARKLAVVALEDEEQTGHLAEHYLGATMLKTALAQIPRRGVLASETRRGLHAYCSDRAAPRDVLPGDAVTNQRTRAWVAKLVPLLTAGGAFIAVGAEHVDVGSLALPDLLRAEGFRVEPLAP